MLNKLKAHKVGVLLISSIVCVLLIGSTANAETPVSVSTIYGCYRPSGIAQGQLMIIDSTDTCPTGYTTLNWNQQGVAGISGYEIVTKVSANWWDTVICPTGKKVVSGGVRWNGIPGSPINAYSIVSSYPTSDGTGWTIISNISSSTHDIFAVCVNVNA